MRMFFQSPETHKHQSLDHVEVASSLHVSFVNSVVHLWMKCPKQKLGEDVNWGEIAAVPSSD